MRTRWKVVLVAGLVTAGLVPVALAAGPVSDALAQRAAQARWPAERARVEQALDAVVLASRFEPVACASVSASSAVESQARCWRVEGTPESVVDELAAALGAAGVERPQTECGGPPDDAGQPLGCVVHGEVERRRVAATVVRELRERPAASEPSAPAGRDGRVDRDDLFATTSAVLLGADLAAP